MHILTINAGSSSLKIKLFQFNDRMEQPLLLLSGAVNDLLSVRSSFSLKDSNGKLIFSEQCELGTDVYLSALELVLNCNELKQYKLDAAIHRVVHGGDIYTNIVKINDEVVQELSKFNDYAPLHQPYNLLVIDAIRQKLPTLPNYACFDTAFHQSIPLINRIYAIDWKYTESGIKKYGFHGLSYDYISHKLVNIVGEKDAKASWIIAHLGGGSSLCAIQNGKSMVTTMGFSCADGLPMMTRCGELDPQIPIFLQQKYNFSPMKVLNILNKESGLYGICQGKSMQEVAESDTQKSKLAVELYCKSIASNIAKLAVDLNELTGIVFTAGIGENRSAIREKVCASLEWLFELKLDNAKNSNNETMIHAEDSKVQVLVIPTNEELVMVSQFIDEFH